MMELENSGDNVTVREADGILKRKCLSPGATGEHTEDQLSGLNLPVTENGFVCDRSTDTEGSQISCENSSSDMPAVLQSDSLAGSSSIDTEDERHPVSECVNDSSVVDEEAVSNSAEISQGVLASDTDNNEVDVEEAAANEDISHGVLVSDTDDREVDGKEAEAKNEDNSQGVLVSDTDDREVDEEEAVAKNDNSQGVLVSDTDDHGEEAAAKNEDNSQGVASDTDDHEVDEEEAVAKNEDNSQSVLASDTDDREVDEEEAVAKNEDNSQSVLVSDTDDREVDGEEAAAKNDNSQGVLVSDTDDHEDMEEAAAKNEDNSQGVLVSDTDDHEDMEETAAKNEDNSQGVVVSDTDDHEVEHTQHGAAVDSASKDAVGEDLQLNHDPMEVDDGPGQNTSLQGTGETSCQDSVVVRSGVEGGSLHDASEVKSLKKPKSDAPVPDHDVICLDEDEDSKDNYSSSKEITSQNVNGMKQVSQKRAGEGSQSGVGKGNKTTSVRKSGAVVTKSTNSDDSVVFVHVDDDSRPGEDHNNPRKDQNCTDDEKENKGTGKSSSDVKEVGGERKNNQKVEVKDNGKLSDSGDDEVEIIGESKVVQVSKPNRPVHASQNIVYVPAGRPSLNQNSVVPSSGGQSLPSNRSSTFVPRLGQSPAMLRNVAPGTNSQRMPSVNPNFVAGSVTGQQQQKVPFLFSSGAPPKPQSSLDQIELIRWEIQSRINTRPKYFKPNPASELGSLAKFLFDIGSDLIKEAVYHDLVKIQSKKKNQNKLNDKEKEDLGKLKEIEKDLYATIGHLKLKLKKKCRMCDFRTESVNVMFQHSQYPHEDSKGIRCSHCSFATKQAIAFKVHMETRHGIQPKLHDKKATFECELCPYENNHEQKLNLHKQRCIKQFRPYFNLHPSCLSGAEINLCLENIFYKPILPKNLHLFQQQKHAHLRPPMTDAQKQQAEIKSIAAQNTAAAIVAKRQLSQASMPALKGPRYSVPANGRMPVPVKLVPGQPQQQVRYSPAADTKGSRSTIASMLNSQQSSTPPASAAPPPRPPPGVFEVCEICGGFVKDRKALRIHFFYAHRIDLPFNLFERNQAPLYCATCYVRFWTAQGLRKHIDSHKEGNQSRGVVGKCILCSHQVLNLLLHMRLVHNRDMQHYLNLNMCMFCGVKTGSRQECENHIVNVHGQVDPVSGTLKPLSSAPIQPQKQQPQKQQPQKQLPQKVVVEQKKMVNKPALRGCVCVLCNLRFSRNVDLTRHCMRMHHTCMKCGMVVVDKPSLMKHVCLVSSVGVRDCVVCGDTGYHPAYYIKHLRDKHLRKLSIKVARLSAMTIQRWTQGSRALTESEDNLVEISDDDEDEADKQQKSPSTQSSENIPSNECTDKTEENVEEPADSEGQDKTEENVEEPADSEGQDKTEENVEEPADSEGQDKNSLAEEVVERVEEVIDLDPTREDSRSSDIVQGNKRKCEEPTSDTESKRAKTE